MATKPPKQPISFEQRQGVGAPSKLTNETLTALTEALEATCNVKDACLYAGISESTYESWMRQGKADEKAGKDSQFVRFIRVTEEAKKAARPKLMVMLRNTALRDPKSLQFLLERRYPEDFGKRDTLSIRDKTGEPEVPRDEDALPLILEVLDDHPEVKAKVLERLTK